jgi:hypothetical protein
MYRNKALYSMMLKNRSLKSNCGTSWKFLPNVGSIKVLQATIKSFILVTDGQPGKLQVQFFMFGK